MRHPAVVVAGLAVALRCSPAAATTTPSSRAGGRSPPPPSRPTRGRAPTAGVRTRRAATRRSTAPRTARTVRDGSATRPPRGRCRRRHRAARRARLAERRDRGLRHRLRVRRSPTRSSPENGRWSSTRASGWSCEVITAAQRIPTAPGRHVDIVVRNMTDQLRALAADRVLRGSTTTPARRCSSAATCSRRGARARRSGVARAAADLRGQAHLRPGRHHEHRQHPEARWHRRRSRSPPPTTRPAWCSSRTARPTASAPTTPCWPDWRPRTRTPSCWTRSS